MPSLSRRRPAHAVPRSRAACRPTSNGCGRGRPLLQHLPGVRRFYRYCLPLFPALIEQFDLDDYDLVISTSHCAAKAVVKTGRARHLCYCFTPMRYAWDQFDAYFGEARVGQAGQPACCARSCGRWPAGTRRRPAGWTAMWLSHNTLPAGSGGTIIGTLLSSILRSIRSFYCPQRWRGRARRDFLLIVSALVPYKRIDLAIEASRLSGVPLRIVGDGPERDA